MWEEQQLLWDARCMAVEDPPSEQARSPSGGCCPVAELLLRGSTRGSLLFVSPGSRSAIPAPSLPVPAPSLAAHCPQKQS